MCGENSLRGETSYHHFAMNINHVWGKIKCVIKNKAIVLKEIIHNLQLKVLKTLSESPDRRDINWFTIRV